MLTLIPLLAGISLVEVFSNHLPNEVKESNILKCAWSNKSPIQNNKYWIA
jgi:hypothetical protein